MNNRNGMRPPGGFAGNVPLIQPRQEPPQIQIQHISKLKSIPELAAPFSFITGNTVNVIGGMTTRLVVAASIMGPLLTEGMQWGRQEQGRDLTPEEAGTIEEFAGRASLRAADVLINMERADRERKQEAEPSPSPETAATPTEA